MEIFIPMLVLGLVTSLHCVSMCGPMVITYALKGTEEGSLAEKVVPNLAYQFAKIFSYVLVGLALGALGGLIDLAALRPYVMVLAGAFMIVLALGMTGKFPWAARLTPRPPKFLLAAMNKVRVRANTQAAADQSSLSTPVLFGLLTGLMPCAPLIAAQLQAIAAGDALTGALGLMFSMTQSAPLMLGFGMASSLLPAKLKQRAMIVLAVVVLAFGFTYLNRGAMLLGSPVTFQSVTQSILQGPAQGPVGGFTAGPDGVVEVPLTIANVRFEPSSVVIPDGQPVRLIVDRRETNACSDQLAIPQMNILVDLEPNATTVVDLPAVAAGTYTLTCGMGMMAGSIVAGVPAAASGVSPLLLALFVVVAIAFGFVVHRQRSQGAMSRSVDGNERKGASSPMEPARYLGFTLTEVAVVAGLLLLAILAGQVLGGS
ncbi:MAG: sulfite exporter TauE/SafE family protein [Actinobacteria bacterium]|nr:sulfite exporter TauE/SafE family protein [Actinomycetota bacterium]